jgi:hypothetical protein
MYLAYFDESGDSGVSNSPTQWFVLNCVLVHETKWMTSLNQLIELRKLFRDQHGFSTRSEIKSSDMRKGRGVFFKMHWSLSRRMAFYENVMKYVAKTLTDTSTFCVAVDKIPAHERGNDARELAWRLALQRVHNFCRSPSERAIIFPDEGHSDLIRKLLRKMRRHQNIPSHFGGDALKVPTDRIVEDPNERASHDSYFIQLADWSAYAAHRSAHIDPLLGVSPGLWDLLGDRRVKAVNRLTGGPVGIKVYP